MIHNTSQTDPNDKSSFSESLSPHETARRVMRREAEKIALEKLAWTRENFGDLSPVEIAENLHELRVHQIELEMQNGELRQTQVELDAARSRYYSLYNFAPVGYFTVSQRDIILEANLTASSLLGIDRINLVGKTMSSFIDHEDQDRYYLHCKQLIDSGESLGCELRMKKNDGKFFWGRLDSIVMQDEEDESSVFRIVVSNVTESKQAAEKSYLNDKLLECLSELVLRPEGKVEEFLGFALEQTVKLTGSELGEIHHCGRGTTNFTLAAMVRSGRLTNEPSPDILSDNSYCSGALAAAILRRQPLVLNNSSPTSPFCGAELSGQTTLKNCLTLPVFSAADGSGLIIILANKPNVFSSYDIFQVNLLMEIVWKVIARIDAGAKISVD